MILGRYKKMLFIGFLILFFTTLPGVAGMKFAGSPPDFSKMNELLKKAEDAGKKASVLDPPRDENAEKNYNPPGMPTMPISCENSDKSGCEECYKDAYKNLKKLRRYFEQLRTLYVVTDDFTKAQIAFGDGISGSVGVGALQWNVERTKIQKSFKGFKKAYNKKLNELLERLKKTLEQIAACETKYFDNKDWYNRYGFMFVTFMSMYYAR